MQQHHSSNQGSALSYNASWSSVGSLCLQVLLWNTIIIVTQWIALFTDRSVAFLHRYSHEPRDKYYIFEGTSLCSFLLYCRWGNPSLQSHNYYCDSLFFEPQTWINSLNGTHSCSLGSPVRMVHSTSAIYHFLSQPQVLGVLLSSFPLLHILTRQKVQY
jgi:hypothetical protein